MDERKGQSSLKLKTKKDLKVQIFLAIIPCFVTQLIAFYRINKFKKGGLLILGLFWIIVVVEFFFVIPDLDKFHIMPWVIQTSILIPFSVYFVRKWTKDYNKKHGSEIAGVR